MFKRIIRAMLPVLVCVATSVANAAPFIIHETGVETKVTPGPGTKLTPNDNTAASRVADPNWTVTSSPLGAFTPVTAAQTFPVGGGTWAADGPLTARWIGSNNAGGTSVAVPPGDYTFETTFNLTGFLHGTATINGTWAVDNLAQMFLNGVAVANITNPASFGSLVAFDIPVGSNFVAGLNTLTIVVTNTALIDNPMGLIVVLSGDATQVPEIDPAGATVPLVLMFFAISLCAGQRSQRALTGAN